MNKREWDESGLRREFQATVRAWLTRTGLSEKAAADTCGFSQSVINRWLTDDPNYLVQPTVDTLEKLSPKIGITVDELSRQAGRRNDPVPAAAKPVELQMFLRDVEAGWWASPEHERPIRSEVARAAWPTQHSRRGTNRRVRGNDARLDQPNDDYRMHKLQA